MESVQQTADKIYHTGWYKCNKYHTRWRTILFHRRSPPPVIFFYVLRSIIIFLGSFGGAPPPSYTTRRRHVPGIQYNIVVSGNRNQFLIRVLYDRRASRSSRQFELKVSRQIRRMRRARELGSWHKDAEKMRG